MTFSRKIFIAVFLSTIVLGTVLIWAAYTYVSKQTEEKFVSRYSVFTNILSNTLSRLDVNTEELMLNAAKVVVAADAEKGLLSTDELKRLRDDLKMTHVFVTDDNGKFVRSTNEDPLLIPNLFSFCSDYKKLVRGTSVVEATPVIKPHPEPKPFKFVSVPSRDKKRIIEVGVRVDFIAKTLAEAAGSDKNVIAMSLYAPDGTPFGRFVADKVAFTDTKINLPPNLNGVVESDGNYKFYSKVISSHPQCCQCDASGTSRNGEYYYVLESEVSKSELKAVLATTRTTFFLIALGNFIFSLLISRFVSRRLVHNIEKAVDKVRKIKEQGDVKDRVNLDGKDEVAYLTHEFDHLLDTLESTQKAMVEAEKVQAKVQMAREVAHNIRSPIIAIEMMLPSMSRLPERLQNTLRNSVKEIKALTERLKNQADSLAESNSDGELEVLYLPIILQDIVSQKQLEYSGKCGVSFSLQKSGVTDDAFISANVTELKSILSNIINNAIESYGHGSGVVYIEWYVAENNCVVVLRDNGVGIPSNFLTDLGKRRITFKGGQERGLGLVHAFRTIESWGGVVEISSTIGKGTAVTIKLPKTISSFKKTLLISSEEVV